MMVSPQMVQEPARSRVSIVERLVPSISFALAALSGAAGATWMQMAFSAMRSVENVGHTAFYNAIAEIFAVVAIGMLIAAAAGLLGIATSAIRMFTSNKKSSPPGALFLLPAAICLISPLITGYAGWLAISTLNSPGTGNMGSMGGTINILSWLAISIAVLALVILPAFSFIPFSSRNGRKLTPLLFLVVIESAFAVLAVDFLLGLRICWSLAEAHY